MRNCPRGSGVSPSLAAWPPDFFPEQIRTSLREEKGDIMNQVPTTASGDLSKSSDATDSLMVAPVTRKTGFHFFARRSMGFRRRAVDLKKDFAAPSCRTARRRDRQIIRERVSSYDRRRLLPTLIHCPEEWLSSTRPDVAAAILRRLKLSLYQQRQARASQHYTYCRSRYDGLLVAIGGELAAQHVSCFHRALRPTVNRRHDHVSVKNDHALVDTRLKPIALS